MAQLTLSGSVVGIASITALLLSACTAPPPIPPPSVEAAVTHGVCLVQVNAWRVEVIQLNGSRRSYNLPVNHRRSVALTDRISPDGRYVVGSDTAISAGIGLDGQVLWKVPTTRAVRSAISRDGQKVVLLSSDDAKLAIYDVPSGKLSPLGFTGNHPVWSPSGDRLAYDDGANVRIHDPTGGTTIDAGPGTEPSWLADATSVAARVGSKIDVIHLATNARTTLFDDARGLSVPRWSPDGDWMMYTKRGGRHWWSIDWTGSEPTQVVLRHARTGAEAFIAAIAKANQGDYTWVTSAELCRAVR